jgi:membrane protein implicated in regulation of membrane protease activity
MSLLLIDTITSPFTLLALAVILMLVDLFLPNDITTHIAYIIFATLLGSLPDTSLLLQILIGVVSWFLIVLIHYTCWRRFVEVVADRLIAPTRFQYGADALIGCEGTVRQIQDKPLVSIKGDLWPVSNADSIEDGTHVKVIAHNNGILEIETERD